MTGTPAGWQPAPDRPGQLRYWDGDQWTEHYAPAPSGGPPAPPQYGAPQQPVKKSHTLRNVLLVLMLLVVLGVGGCFAVIAVTAKGINDTEAKGHDVTYRVTGTAKKADLTYTTDGSTSTSQESGVSLPWKKDLHIDGNLLNVYQVSAQNGTAKGTVTCEILVDGKSVKTATSTGQYSIASCDYSN